MTPDRPGNPPSAAETIPLRLLRWIEAKAKKGTRIEALRGDISARRYFRLVSADGSSRVAAFYPPELRDAYSRFLTAGELLSNVGVRVPKVLFCEPEHELMIIEDLGSRRLFDTEIGAPETERLYTEALEVSSRISTLSRNQVARLNPPLDARLMRIELGQTLELFLAKRVGGQLLFELGELFDRLCAKLGEATRVPCHRDFMSRNLMVLEGRRLAVLDHQDLRLGPPEYDVASLLNDSVRLLPEQLRAAQRATIGNQHTAHFARAAAQRSLKIVGTFCAFAERGAPRYLAMVPAAIERALSHLEFVPEAKELLPALRSVFGA